jgi:hypothetical protein
MTKIVRSPYSVASRAMIMKLIRAGYLSHAKRRDAEAIETALAEVRKVSGNEFATFGGPDDPPPAA